MCAADVPPPDLFAKIEGFFDDAIACVAAAPADKQRELFPEESGAVRRAQPSRQQQFATGRWCARAALRRLGVEDHAIAAGERGEPVWPAGITGSITHCPGLCVAAVAEARHYAGLGIDAEPDTPLKASLAARICTPEELAVLPDDAQTPWTKLIFSAKESVYKAQYPLTRTFLGFQDVELTLLPEQAAFRARVTKPGAEAEWDGRYLVQGGLIFTAALAPAS